MEHTVKKIKIYCFEGLGSYYLAFLTRQVKKIIQENGLSEMVEIVKYSWTDSVVIDDDSIICGHSYGAHNAWLHSIQGCLALFTNDIRKPGFFNNGFYNYRIRELNSITYNFFQTGFVRGWEIDLAMNYNVGPCMHTSVPKNKFFKELLVRTILKQINKGA